MFLLMILLEYLQEHVLFCFFLQLGKKLSVSACIFQLFATSKIKQWEKIMISLSLIFFKNKHSVHLGLL